MKQFLKIGCLGLLALGALAVAGLLFLAWRAEPLPSTAVALASLPPAERAALEAICAQAGIEPDALRNIGAYDRDLFDHELNQRSVVIRGGHVVALCLRGVTFTAVPDLGQLSALEGLSLRGSSLTQWPDLSGLAALKQVDLSQQPLPTPGAGLLPVKIQTLKLAGTKIDDLAPLARLTQLTELDLSGTPVTTFEPLLGLKLAKLNLAGTNLNTLPASLPREGSWEIDLDGTPLLNPPGYSARWPFDGWITSTANAADSAQGGVGKDKVDVAGTAAPTTKPRAVKLPRTTDPNAPPVFLEVTCTSGQARVWLEEPADFFPSPWMKRGHVKGFGALRRGGYVWAEVSPEKPAKLRGSLRLTTQSRVYEMPAGQRSEARKAPDWCDYSFYLEPLGGAVEGVAFKVTNAR